MRDIGAERAIAEGLREYFEAKAEPPQPAVAPDEALPGTVPYTELLSLPPLPPEAAAAAAPLEDHALSYAPRKDCVFTATQARAQFPYADALELFIREGKNPAAYRPARLDAAPFLSAAKGTIHPVTQETPDGWKVLGALPDERPVMWRVSWRWEPHELDECAIEIYEDGEVLDIPGQSLLDLWSVVSAVKFARAAFAKHGDRQEDLEPFAAAAGVTVEKLRRWRDGKDPLPEDCEPLMDDKPVEWPEDRD